MVRPAKLKACTYDQSLYISLDGGIGVSISALVLCTTVNLKLVAPLLSKAECHTLGIVSYHPHLQAVQRGLPVLVLNLPERDMPLRIGSEKVERKISPDLTSRRMEYLTSILQKILPRGRLLQRKQLLKWYQDRPSKKERVTSHKQV